MRPSLLTASLFTAVTAQTQYLTALLLTNQDLSSFANALRNVSSFAGSLNGNYNITIFAPTNQAFETLLAGSNTPERRAVSGGSKDDLEKLLAFHVVNGTYTSSNFTETQTNVNTLSYSGRSFSNYTASDFSGPTIGLVKNGTNATILSGQMQSSNVVQADIQTIPGITVHKIDKVLNDPRNDTVTGSATVPAVGKLGGGIAAIGMGLALVL